MSIIGSGRASLALSGPPIIGPGGLASTGPEILGANFDAYRLSRSSDSFAREIAPELINSLGQLSQMFPEQQHLNPYVPGGGPADFSRRNRTSVRYSDDQLERVYKSKETQRLIRQLGKPEIRPYDEILEDMRRKVDKAELHQAGVMARAASPVIGAGLSVLGTMGAAVIDPPVLATMPLGLGSGAALWKVMLTEGLLGGGVETPVQLSAKNFREKLGLKTEDSEIIANIAAATVGSGLFAGALVGSGRALRRAYDAIDAGRLVRRGVSKAARAELAAIEESDALASSLVDEAVAVDAPVRVEAMEMHAEALEEATDAVLAGNVDEVPNLHTKLAQRAEKVRDQIAEITGEQDTSLVAREGGDAPQSKAAAQDVGQMVEDFAASERADVDALLEKFDRKTARMKGQTLLSVVIDEGRINPVADEIGDGVLPTGASSGFSKHSKINLTEMLETLKGLGEMLESDTEQDLLDALAKGAPSAAGAERQGARLDFISGLEERLGFVKDAEAAAKTLKAKTGEELAVTSEREFVRPAPGQAKRAAKLRRLRKREAELAEAAADLAENEAGLVKGQLVGRGESAFRNRKVATAAARGLGLKRGEYKLRHLDRGKWGFEVSPEAGARVGLEPEVTPSDVGMDHGVPIREQEAPVVTEPTDISSAEMDAMLDAAVESIPPERRWTWNETTGEDGRPELGLLDDVLERIDEDEAAVNAVLACSRGISSDG